MYNIYIYIYIYIYIHILNICSKKDVLKKLALSRLVLVITLFKSFNIKNNFLFE